MAKRPKLKVAVVAVFISPGVGAGAGGFMITAGGKIIKIPPRGPLTASIKKIGKAIAAGI